MGRNHLQLVKPALIIGIAVLVAAAIALVLWPQASVNMEASGENSYKPMVTFQGKVYGWDGEVDSLPADAAQVAVVEHSLGTINQAVVPSAGDLVSNSFSEGSKIYQDGGRKLYLCEDDGCVRLQKIK